MLALADQEPKAVFLETLKHLQLLQVHHHLALARDSPSLHQQMRMETAYLAELLVEACLEAQQRRHRHSQVRVCSAEPTSPRRRIRACSVVVQMPQQHQRVVSSAKHHLAHLEDSEELNSKLKAKACSAELPRLLRSSEISNLRQVSAQEAEERSDKEN